MFLTYIFIFYSYLDKFIRSLDLETESVHPKMKLNSIQKFNNFENQIKLEKCF